MRRETELERYWPRIKEAFGYCCAYCGCEPAILCVEHMTPTSRGGDDAIENIVPACRPCNSKKRDLTPLEWICVRLGLLRREGVTYDTLVAADLTPEPEERWARVYNDLVIVYGETPTMYRCRFEYRGYERCVRKDLAEFIDTPMCGDWVWLASQGGAL